ncbi:MAG: YqcI/YcgG family protein [Verrucomicrobia bacterium]|nr:YqcI/YcgG family protein [Verrucomicrobiota bacterium]
MEIDHYLQFRDNALVSAIDHEKRPSDAAMFVHTQFRAMILNAQFPCPGARTTFSQGSYRFGLFDRIGTKDSAECLGSSLRRFIEERKSMNTMYTAFVSCYREPIPMSHLEFAHALWTMLQELHVTDLSEWDPSKSSDPESPDFAFSYGGLSFFIAGMHSGSPRFARKFGWPTLVFNAHEQFAFLRNEGIFEKFRDLVRKRDTSLQGHVNPVSTDHGMMSEAIQYTGKIDSNEWKCPFHHKKGE